MTPGDPRREAVARYLRQRTELGEVEIHLSSMRAEEALRLAEKQGTRQPVTRAVSGHGDAGPDVERAPRTTGPQGGSGAPGRPSPVAVGPRGSGGTDEAFSPPREYLELRDTALACTRCRLAQGRTQVVFSDGNPSGRLVVVGEAPGAQEDRTGLPFVGPAGRLLDLLLASIGLSRQDSVYICNVIKCRPPGNRNPLPDEIEACSPYLRRQIELVSPEAMLAVGTFSAQLLTGLSTPLGKLRGQVYSYGGVPVVVTYHPAALLRNPGWTRATWEDLQLLRQIMDGA